MRIQHNIMALNAHRNSGVNQTAVSKNMEKLSSGYRINRAGDDAAGLSISEKMRSQIRGLSQASRNAQDGISYIQTAEGALNEVSAMLTRAKELHVQKANDTYSAEDLVNISKELTALDAEITNVLAKTSFNGKTVFTETAVEIAISHDASATLEIDSSLSISLAGATTAALVDGLIDTVNTKRADFGALQNRLEHTINNLGTTTENLVAAESRIRDVDMASEMMEMTKNNILSQAAQAMIAQANQQPQNVLQLLR